MAGPIQIRYDANACTAARLTIPPTTESPSNHQSGHQQAVTHTTKPPQTPKEICWTNTRCPNLDEHASRTQGQLTRHQHIMAQPRSKQARLGRTARAARARAASRSSSDFASDSLTVFAAVSGTGTGLSCKAGPSFTRTMARTTTSGSTSGACFLLSPYGRASLRLRSSWSCPFPVAIVPHSHAL